MTQAGSTFTAGPVKYDPESGDVVMADEVGARIASVDIENCENVNQADADGLLIAEAFTVAHETGLTPRQLVEQRDELLAALGRIVDLTKPGQTVNLSQATDIICDAWNAARAAIAKATAGGAV